MFSSIKPYENQIVPVEEVMSDNSLNTTQTSSPNSRSLPNLGKCGHTRFCRASLALSFAV